LYFVQQEINDETFIFWIEQGATKTRLNRIAKLKEDTDKNQPLSIDYLFSEKPKCDCEY